MKTKKNFLTVSIIGLLLAASLIGCAAQDDVTFARNVLSLLIRGRIAAFPMIDWPKLKMLGYDVGKEYSKYRTEEERATYARAFIENFARGFNEKKAKETAFFNWQNVSRDRAGKIQTVSANCVTETRTFLFVIKHAGVSKKLIEVYVLETPSGARQAAPQGADKNVPQSE